jgi:hypothetical protein
MKTAAKLATNVTDPFDLDDRGFLVGYRFLGMIRRKPRRLSKRVVKVVVKRLKKA